MTSLQHALRSSALALCSLGILASPSAIAETETFLRLAELHPEMLAAYRAQRWNDAKAQIRDCRGLEPKLTDLYDVYEDRIRRFEADAPKPGWDGVFRATAK